MSSEPSTISAALALQPSPEAPEERLLRLLRAYGWNSTSFQTLEHGYRYWFDPELDAAVAYCDTGSAWVAAGAPICAEKELGAVASRFCRAAAAHRRRVGFFGIEERLGVASGLRVTLVGEQPVWDPRRFAERVEGDRTLRSQIRRARAKGVETRVAQPSELVLGTPLRAALDVVIDAWLADRKTPPLGFLVRVQPFEHAAERRYVVAVREGRPVGFAVAVPIYARSGWLLEDLLRTPEAPNGTAEAMVDRMMRTLASEGSTYVTLGLSPLRGAVAPWLRLVGKLARPLYDFSGLAAFKSKLRPDRWDAIYVAHPRRTSSVRVLLDGLGAFTGGLFRFTLRVIARRIAERRDVRPRLSLRAPSSPPRMRG